MLLDHAACNDDLCIFFSPGEQLFNRIQDLLPGSFQKDASIDDKVIGFLYVLNTFVSILEQKADHHFAIDPVPGTAQSGKMKFILK